MAKRILFVCTGNTCRSPLAEGLLRTMATKRGAALEIRSAGVAAVDGYPISAYSSEILREKGHTEAMSSNALTAGLAAWADLVLTMTTGHKRQVIQRFPQLVDKVFTLKEYVLDDPQVLAGIVERERLIAALQLQQALAQPVAAEDRKRLEELTKLLPDYDIADPFGGSKADYEQVTREIEACLEQLLARLEAENGEKNNG